MLDGESMRLRVVMRIGNFWEQVNGVIKEEMETGINDKNGRHLTDEQEEAKRWEE